MLKGEHVPDPHRRDDREGRGDNPKENGGRKTWREEPDAPPHRFVFCVDNEPVGARTERSIRVKLGKFGPKGNIREGTDILVEPIDLPEQGILMARTLSRVKNNTCWVRVVNTSQEEIVLPRNLKLGAVEELMKDDLLCSAPEARRLVVLADSHGRGIQQLLEERLPSHVKVVVEFAPNGTVGEVTRSLATWLKKLGPLDSVLVLGGTNDVDVNRHQNALRRVFDKLPKTWTSHLIMAEVPDRHDRELVARLREANVTLRGLVGRTSKKGVGTITLLPLHGSFPRTAYTKHGIHLNDRGKVQLVQLILGKLHRHWASHVKTVRPITRHDTRALELAVDNKLNHLGANDKHALSSLLLKFKDVIAYGDDEPLGCTSAVKHQIHTGDAPPVYKKAYRVPHAQKPILDKLVKDQLDQGIIRPSHSPWASPVVIVPKKSEDGTPKYRFCVDYREVNALTVPDVYPLPNITETLDSLGNCKIFTALDLKSGYHQIQIDEKSRAKTAFNVPGGHYEYMRMPFGLKTAPATFQRLMDSVLAGLKGEHCLVYLDDIIIFSEDMASHVESLERVLKRLQGVNLSIQLSKCKLAVEEVDYLGHCISRRGLEPDPKKISAVRNFPIPLTVKDVRSFLGLAGYYRRFIENFAEIGRPLFDLTRQDNAFEWTKGCQAAFEELKGRLISAPVLAFPDFNHPFILATDASALAIGAVLSQNINGEEHPVAYASRTLFPAEKNYSTTERELLSLVWATKYFRCYLLGRNFKVITDHSALRWMLSLKDPSSRLVRWALRLSEFDYTVEHKAGKKHTNADGLSRAVASVNVVRQQVLPVVDLDRLRTVQNADAHCQDLKRGKAFRMSPEKVLYRLQGGQKRIVVPRGLANEVIRLHHDLPTAGHAAVAKTLDRVRDKFWWKGMEKDVIDYVRTCKSCNQRSNYGQARAPLGKLFNEPKAPFEVIAADIVGPLPVSGSGNIYILSVMDHFTRYCEFIPLPDQTAEQIARALVQRVITKFGVPKALITDQGANFTSDLIKQLCKFLHVRKIQTTGFHPQSNGRLERVHATVARMLSHFVGKHQSDWDEYLPYISMAYNSQGHESTGFSPYEMLFGRKMEAPAEADFTITDDSDVFGDHVETLREKLRETHALAEGYKAKARLKYEKQYNQRAKVREYRVGQKVLLHVPSVGRFRVKKLTKLWRGPYSIVKILSPLDVMLRIRRKEVVVHVNRIKPYLEREVKPPLEEDVGMEPDEEVRAGSTNEDVKPGVSGAPVGRQGRERRKPKRLEDYVE